MVLTELPKTALKLLNNLNFFLSDQAYFIVLMFKLFVCQTFTTSSMMAVGTPFCIPFGNNTLGLMRFSFKPVFWFHQHTNGAKFKSRGSSFVLPYINVNTFLRLRWWFFRGHIRFPPKGAFIQLLLLRGLSSTLQLDVSTLHFPSVLSSNFTPEFGKRNDVPKFKDSYFVIQCLQDTTIDNKNHCHC